jgi:hypothetical protein
LQPPIELSERERGVLLTNFRRKLRRRGDRLLCRVADYRYWVCECYEHGDPPMFAGKCQCLKRWPPPFHRPVVRLPRCFDTEEEAVAALFDSAARCDQKFVSALRRRSA